MSGGAAAGGEPATGRLAGLDKRGCRRLVSETIAEWRRTGAPDARAVLEAHPELRRHKSLALELAYEEYCLRTGEGEFVEAGAFCRRFPSFQKSLERRLQIHLLVEDGLSLGEELPPTRWPRPGDCVAGYDLLEELGRGAFARAYLAQERALGRRHVVVKLCRGGAEEAETLGRLEHPNIAPVLSVQETDQDGWTILCMPFLARATLCDVLDAAAERPLDSANALLEAVRQVNDATPRPRSAGASRPRLRGDYVRAVLQIGLQLAEALAYAHSQGVWHLDLKPSNVLMTNNGAPLLLDFNLAMDRRRASSRLGGTLPYMSPEQVRVVMLEEPGDGSLNARSDVYSLGVILYELLYGALPFSGALRHRSLQETARELLLAQARGARPPAAGPVPPSAARLVERCLQFEPHDRYATAVELAEAIRRELTWSKAAGRWIRRRKWLAAAAAAALAAGTAGAAYVVATWPSRAQRLLAQAREASRQGDAAAALAALDQAVQEDPDAIPPRLLRARLAARQGDFYAAIRDLEVVLRQRRDPQIMAYMGYCCARLRMFGDATHWFQQAADAGLNDCILLNDLGYSWFCLGAMASARDCLVSAAQIASSPTVRCNLLRLRVQEMQTNPAGAIDGVALAKSLLRDGFDGRLVCECGALLAAKAAKIDPRYQRDCLDFARRFVFAGGSVDRLMSIPDIASLVSRSDLDGAAAGVRSDGKVPPALLEPQLPDE